MLKKLNGEYKNIYIDCSHLHLYSSVFTIQINDNVVQISSIPILKRGKQQLFKLNNK